MVCRNFHNCSAFDQLKASLAKISLMLIRWGEKYSKVRICCYSSKSIDLFSFFFSLDSFLKNFYKQLIGEVCI